MKNKLQIEASDPVSSVWVSASAGTGKTKILTDRVLRLLINGADINKILCLTFTNAAANEMNARINSSLAKWSVASEAEIQSQLESIFGRKPQQKELLIARELYRKIINTDDKINIYTIHSFCQKILKIFPLEAGVNPAFQILDEITAKAVIHKIKNQLFIDAQNSSIVDFFTANFHETTIDDIFDQIIAQKLKFKQLFSTVPFANTIISKFASKACLSKEQVLAKYSQYFLNIFGFYPDIEKIKLFFLTKEGNKRKRLNIKTSLVLQKQLFAIQEEIYKLDQYEKTCAVIEHTKLLSNLAEIFLAAYDQHKHKYSLLDYDDLIYFTYMLLTNNSAKDWVLYKLDGGIDHLLVDEAQDTSKEQWQIIEAIIAEFYSGDGASDYERTIFVVGDEKQSIFSFQGADLSSFSAMNSHLKAKLLSAKKDFKIIDLEYSYRSTKEILDAVHSVFEQVKISKPHLFLPINSKIQAHRKFHTGNVTLWPLTIVEKEQENFWPLPMEPNHKLPKRELAIRIALYIKQQIDSQVILPSTNQPAAPKDFMILVRRRDDLVHEIINQLQFLNIEVSGIDRLLLNKNLSVLDLISAAKFVLCPLDNLNLACLLKSPLIGLIDSDIEKLRINTDSSLWQEILNLKDTTAKDIYDNLQALIDLYYVSDIANFFHIIVDQFDFRKELISTNGIDSKDIIDEFLFLCSNYANSVQSSIQSFIHWFEENEVEIKRNVESSDKVKIMTIHAAKGLEAPVVILCDTTKLPINQDKFIWLEDGTFIYSPKAAAAPDFLKDIKDAEYQKDMQEYLRLLYVGMTRAKDNLILCGHSSTSTIPENCWYKLVAKSIALSTEVEVDISAFEKEVSSLKVSPFYQRGLRRGCLNKSKLCLDKSSFIPFFQKKVTFSKEGTNLLPQIAGVEYGRTFHKILDDCAKSNNILNLKRHPLIETLSIKMQQKINYSIDRLLSNNEFLELFDLEIKTELNIGITAEYGTKVGRIDLLSMGSKHINIVDYKSDVNQSVIPINYAEQLNFYRSVIKELYPTHNITCKILWLENGEFVTI